LIDKETRDVGIFDFRRSKQNCLGFGFSGKDYIGAVLAMPSTLGYISSAANRIRGPLENFLIT